MSDESARAVSGTERDVCADIAARQRVGIEKYGMTVSDAMSDSIEYCPTCETNVECHLSRKCLDRPSSLASVPFSEYVPFGDEWRAEVMKMRKADIIEILRKALTQNGI